MSLPNYFIQEIRQNTVSQEPLDFNPIIYAQKVLPSWKEAFIESIPLFKTNLSQSGFVRGFFTSKERMRYIRKILAGANIFTKYRTLGASLNSLKTLRNDLRYRSKDIVYIDFYARRDRFGVGNLYRYDLTLRTIYEYGYPHIKIVFSIPPNLSQNVGVHQSSVNSYIKSVFYANGLEITRLIPYICQYSLKDRTDDRSGKNLIPVIGYVGIATKIMTYNIDCLYKDIPRIKKHSKLFSRHPDYYMENITDDRKCVRYMWTWKTYKKYLIYAAIDGRLKDII